MFVAEITFRFPLPWLPGPGQCAGGALLPHHRTHVLLLPSGGQLPRLLHYHGQVTQCGKTKQVAIFSTINDIEFSFSELMFLMSCLCMVPWSELRHYCLMACKTSGTHHRHNQEAQDEMLLQECYYSLSLYMSLCRVKNVCGCVRFSSIRISLK